MCKESYVFHPIGEKFKVMINGKPVILRATKLLDNEDCLNCRLVHTNCFKHVCMAGYRKDGITVKFVEVKNG